MSVSVEDFVEELRCLGVDFFAGVPDSLLKSFCAYVTDTCDDNHIIAANEGGAVGLAPVTQSCAALCDLVDCSPPDSSVHRISQARILDWVAISFSRESSQPRN